EARARGTGRVAAGGTGETATVNVIGDHFFESNETFQVNLSSPTNATISDSQGVGTITNDDVQQTATIAATAPNAVETTPAVEGTFTITRTSGSTAIPLTVNYALSGTATNGTDYVTLPGTATIPAGSTS